jgi:xanthine dehydrogenase molybdopterin-binding subunit B
LLEKLAGSTYSLSSIFDVLAHGVATPPVVFSMTFGRKVWNISRQRVHLFEQGYINLTNISQVLQQRVACRLVVWAAVFESGQFRVIQYASASQCLYFNIF